MFPSMAVVGLLCVEKTKTSGLSLFPCGSPLLISALRHGWQVLILPCKQFSVQWNKFLPVQRSCILKVKPYVEVFVPTPKEGRPIWDLPCGCLHSRLSPWHGRPASSTPSCPVLPPPCPLLQLFFFFKIAINSDHQNQACCDNTWLSNLLWKICDTFSVLCF